MSYFHGFLRKYFMVAIGLLQPSPSFSASAFKKLGEELLTLCSSPSFLAELVKQGAFGLYSQILSRCIVKQVDVRKRYLEMSELLCKPLTVDRLGVRESTQGGYPILQVDGFLPSSVLRRIFTYCSPSDVGFSLSLTCHYFHSIIETARFWKTMYHIHVHPSETALWKLTDTDCRRFSLEFEPILWKARFVLDYVYHRLSEPSYCRYLPNPAMYSVQDFHGIPFLLLHTAGILIDHLTVELDKAHPVSIRLHASGVISFDVESIHVGYQQVCRLVRNLLPKAKILLQRGLTTLDQFAAARLFKSVAHYVWTLCRDVSDSTALTTPPLVESKLRTHHKALIRPLLDQGLFVSMYFLLLHASDLSYRFFFQYYDDETKVPAYVKRYVYLVLGRQLLTNEDHVPFLSDEESHDLDSTEDFFDRHVHCRRLAALSYGGRTQMCCIEFFRFMIQLNFASTFHFLGTKTPFFVDPNPLYRAMTGNVVTETRRFTFFIEAIYEQSLREEVGRRVLLKTSGAAFRALTRFFCTHPRHAEFGGQIMSEVVLGVDPISVRSIADASFFFRSVLRSALDPHTDHDPNRLRKALRRVTKGTKMYARRQSMQRCLETFIQAFDLMPDTQREHIGGILANMAEIYLQLPEDEDLNRILECSAASWFYRPKSTKVIQRMVKVLRRMAKRTNGWTSIEFHRVLHDAFHAVGPFAVDDILAGDAVLMEMYAKYHRGEAPRYRFGVDIGCYRRLGGDQELELAGSPVPFLGTLALFQGEPEIGNRRRREVEEDSGEERFSRVKRRESVDSIDDSSDL